MQVSTQLTKSVSVKVTVSDDPPAPGKSHVLDIEWSRTPSRVTLRKYMKFMNRITQGLADKWDMPLAYCYQLTERPAGWITYRFEPGGRPVRL